MDLAIVLGVLGAYVVGRAVYQELWGREARINNRLAVQPREYIAAVREGPVRVVGLVRASGEVLRAPVTARPCVAFTLKVVDRSSRWKSVVVELAQAVPFVVADETGQVLVDPDGSRDITLEPDRVRVMGGAFERMRPEERQRLTSLIEARGDPTTTWLGSERKFAFEEGILGIDAPVAVGGVAVREPTVDGERPALRAPPERLVFRNRGDQPLSISTWREARSVVAKRST